MFRIYQLRERLDLPLNHENLANSLLNLSVQILLLAEELIHLLLASVQKTFWVSQFHSPMMS